MKAIKQITCGGVVAGILLSCAGAASNLASAGSLLIKALIFPIGLLLICYGGFALFTGNIYKIGRDDSLSMPTKILLLTVNYITNLVGAFLVACVIKIPVEPTILAKISATPWRTFLLAIACNFLVCLGVKLFKVSPIATYGCVFLFIALGLEHSIADMYYFLCAPSSYFISCVSILFIVTLGNIIGGILVIMIERIMEHDSRNICRHYF